MPRVTVHVLEQRASHNSQPQWGMPLYGTTYIQVFNGYSSILYSVQPTIQVNRYQQTINTILKQLYSCSKFLRCAFFNPTIWFVMQMPSVLSYLYRLQQDEKFARSDKLRISIEETTFSHVKSWISHYILNTPIWRQQFDKEQNSTIKHQYGLQLCTQRRHVNSRVFLILVLAKMKRNSQ